MIENKIDKYLSESLSPSEVSHAQKTGSLEHYKKLKDAMIEYEEGKSKLLQKMVSKVESNEILLKIVKNEQDPFWKWIKTYYDSDDESYQLMGHYDWDN